MSYGMKDVEYVRNRLIDMMNSDKPVYAYELAELTHMLNSGIKKLGGKGVTMTAQEQKPYFVCSPTP